MITINDIHSLTNINDLTAKEIVDMTGDYFVRGKKLDIASENPQKMFNRLHWILNRVGRVLDVSGKLNPNTTTFRIDRNESGQVSVRFLDLDEKLQYRLIVVDGERYILQDAEGNELVSDPKWMAIRRFFAPAKEETVVKEAAVPKKRKSALKTVKTSVTVTPIESNVMAEDDAVISEEG